RPHLAEDLRPRLRDDLRRPGLRDRHAEPVHVGRGLSAEPVRPWSGDRDGPPHHGRAVDRALPRLEPAVGGRTLSTAAAVARSPFRPARLITYALLLVVTASYVRPVYVMLVPPFASLLELSHTPPW